MTVPETVLSAPRGPAGAPLIVLGASPAATAPFGVAVLADSLVAAASALGETTFLYAGVSLSGTVGLELALRHPDRVQAAAIICSGAQIGGPAGWLECAALVRERGTSVLVEGSSGRWFAPGSIEASPNAVQISIWMVVSEVCSGCGHCAWWRRLAGHLEILRLMTRGFDLRRRAGFSRRTRASTA